MNHQSPWRLGRSLGLCLLVLAASLAVDTTRARAQPTCTYSVAPASGSFGAAGGTGAITLTTASSCTWSASSGAGWINISATSGTGDTSISYSVEPNTGPARTSNIIVQGITHTVTQASGCTISVSPPTRSVGASSSSQTFTLNTGADCPWTLSSTSAWLSGFPASGTSSASISYNVAANLALARSGAIQATLASTSQTANHAVDQANGCTATLGSASASLPAPASNSAVALTLSDGACPWTASSSDAWLTPDVASGTGSTSFVYSAAANTGPARTATLTIAGQTLTVTQASCSVVLVPASTLVGVAGAAISFAVQTAAGCAWTAGTSSGFISAVTASGSGPGSVLATVAANAGPMRADSIRVTATATSQSSDHTVSQASGCVASLAGASATSSAAGGAATVALTLSSPACPWSADSSAAFVSLTDASGTGSRAFEYQVAANSGPARTATLTIAGHTFEVEQASGCAVAVAATQSVPTSAGSASFQVTSAPGCGWTASASAPWLSGLTVSGTGTGDIDFDYAVNPGPTRSAVIRVLSTSTGSAGNHTVQQTDGCIATLSAASAMFSAAGGSGSVELTLSAADCAWSASASDAWLTLNSQSGTGSGTLGFSAAPNVSLTRMGGLQIAGRTFVVTQASGCALLLTPVSADVSAAAGTHMFDLTIDPACSWTAGDSLNWVSGVTPSGTGPATLSWTADQNLGPLRSGAIALQAPESGQTLDYPVSQASGCSATLSESSVMAGSSETSGSVTFTLSSAACPWTAASSDAFIALGTSNGTGDGSVNYTIAANAGPPRMGSIQIADRTLPVSQADGCAVALSPSSADVAAAAGTTQFDVQTAAACEWTATAGVDWLSDLTASGTGPGSVDVAYAQNVDTARTGQVSVSVSSGAAAQFTLSQADGCSVSLPVDEAGASVEGGSSSFAVLTGSGCDYSVSSDVTWVTPSVSASGVEYSVAAWDGAARTARLRVSSESTDSTAEFTITQAGGCTLMLTPGDIRVAAAATTISFDVSTGPACAISATTGSDFLSGIRVDGSTVSVQVAENTADARTGLLAVSAADATGTFVVQQDAAERPLDGGTPLDGGADAGRARNYVVGGGCHVAALPSSSASAAWLLPLATVLAYAWRGCRARRRRSAKRVRA